jgi:hypothetical protein
MAEVLPIETPTLGDRSYLTHDGEVAVVIDLKPRPSIPLIDTMKPRYDMWLLKRYGLPALYWNLMLRGRA